jgi:hypothetical protein
MRDCVSGRGSEAFLTPCSASDAHADDTRTLALDAATHLRTERCLSLLCMFWTYVLEVLAVLDHLNFSRVLHFRAPLCQPRVEKMDSHSGGQSDDVHRSDLINLPEGFMCLRHVA